MRHPFRIASIFCAALLTRVARAVDDALRELLIATARGGPALRALLRRPGGSSVDLNARDEHGLTALAVAAFHGDAEAAGVLIDRGARVTPGEFYVFVGDGRAPVGSVVELVIRRNAMLIMLGTGLQLPEYLREIRKPHLDFSSLTPSPDMEGTLRLIAFRGGARPTEKSVEEGADLARAAYFLDASAVDVLVHLQQMDEEREASDASRGKYRYGPSRALLAALLGIGQLKHRLNRALLSQPRMAGRIFRDFWNFSIGTEEELTSPELHGISFEDTLRFVEGKATNVVHRLLQGRADPSFPQNRKNQKTPLHHCGEHSFTVISELLIQARARVQAQTIPQQRTPLHTATVHRSVGVLRALLESRADPERRDSEGRTARDLARLLRWAEGQRLLGVPPAAAVGASAATNDGRSSALAAPELLPPGWLARWRRGDLGQDVWADPSLTLGDHCDIDIVDASELTTRRFIADYLSLRRPACIRGGAVHMPALQRWQSLRYLRRKAGKAKLSAVSIPYPEDFGDPDARDTRKVTLQEYVDSVMGRVNTSSGTPLYLFAVVESEDPKFRTLRELVQRDAGPHPPWLVQDSGEKSKLRFGNVQFALGPSGSGAPQHYHTHSYNSLFTGRKYWWFFPPPRSALSRKHALRFAQEEAAARRALRPPPLSLLAAGTALQMDPSHLTCVQAPGDVIYVPTDWGHLTLNEGESTISVAREFSWDGEETDSRMINSLQL